MPKLRIVQVSPFGAPGGQWIYLVLFHEARSTMKIKVRYLIARPITLASGHRKFAYYWQPSHVLRRRGWEAKRLSDDLDQAVQQAEGINAELDAWRARGDRLPSPKPRAKGPAAGTVAALIRAYKASDFYTDLAASSRRDYDQKLEMIERIWGDFLLAHVDDVQTRETYTAMRRRTPAQAASLMRVGRLLWNRAPKLGFGKVPNPFERPGIKDTSAKGTLCTREMLAALVWAAGELGRPSIAHACRLNNWLGQREGDLLRAQRDMISGNVLRFRQSKRGAGVALPLDVVPELVAVVQAAAADQERRKIESTHLIVSEETGRPYSVHAFNKVFARVRAKAAERCPAVLALKFMHFRHSAVTRLFEARCEEMEIAAITGHSLASVYQILDRYALRTERMARQALTRRRDYEAGEEL